MALAQKLANLQRTLRLDSHHAIQRFGVMVGALALIGTMVVGGSAVSSIAANQDTFAENSLWGTSFQTSKTELSGTVDGVYVNERRTRALVLMHFDARAKISYSAEDYQAFLLGSDPNYGSDLVKTPGITGSFHVFGATGYVGVLLESKHEFVPQILNLTIRANAELTFAQQQAEGDTADQVVGDSSFRRFDQWRVYVNPGGTDAPELETLDDATFDPARVFYDIVLSAKEKEARDSLDLELAQMRTMLTQISSYTEDLATTKVDGLFLRQPMVPETIAGDEIVGESAAQSEDGKSTLALKSEVIVPGGYDFDWREGNVYDGYLKNLVPSGESYVEYLQNHNEQGANAGAATNSGDIEWVLSNGKNLVNDYRTSDVTMKPLVTVMNNLSQAYQSYYAAKSTYETTSLFQLLKLEVDLRDVRANSTENSSDKFLIIYYGATAG